MEALQAEALSQGGRLTSIASVGWNLAPRCQSSRSVELIGRPQPDPGSKYAAVGRGLGRPTAYLDMEVRCRKCGPCLRARGALWRARAFVECRAAARSWFGTLTLDPDRQMISLAAARDRAARQHLDFDALRPSEQFARRCNAIGPAITLWLKRARKRSRAGMRYLLVAEAHKSGAPHFHVLVHQTNPDELISWRDVHDTWAEGFSKFNLLSDLGQAAYACKYLSKDAAARVRASLRYGRQTVTTFSNTVKT